MSNSNHQKYNFKEILKRTNDTQKLQLLTQIWGAADKSGQSLLQFKNMFFMNDEEMNFISNINDNKSKSKKQQKLRQQNEVSSEPKQVQLIQQPTPNLDVISRQAIHLSSKEQLRTQARILLRNFIHPQRNYKQSCSVQSAGKIPKGKSQSIESITEKQKLKQTAKKQGKNVTGRNQREEKIFQMLNNKNKNIYQGPQETIKKEFDQDIKIKTQHFLDYFTRTINEEQEQIFDKVYNQLRAIIEPIKASIKQELEQNIYHQRQVKKIKKHNKKDLFCPSQNSFFSKLDKKLHNKQMQQRINICDMQLQSRNQKMYKQFIQDQDSQMIEQQVEQSNSEHTYEMSAIEEQQILKNQLKDRRKCKTVTTFKKINNLIKTTDGWLVMGVDKSNQNVYINLQLLSSQSWSELLNSFFKKR